MAKQSLADLNEYLFAQLDALSNDDLTGDEYGKEGNVAIPLIGMTDK